MVEEQKMIETLKAIIVSCIALLMVAVTAVLCVYFCLWFAFYIGDKEKGESFIEYYRRQNKK